nr:hypothetical protein [Mycoplasmopsis agalactiae]
MLFLILLTHFWWSTLNNSPVISEAETLWLILSISLSTLAASLASSAFSFLSISLIASVYVSSKILAIKFAAFNSFNLSKLSFKLAFSILLTALSKSSFVQWISMSKPDFESL